ncbi:hypothetical protein ABPG72_004588 [Tetrahymena utriculariae]
MKDSNGNLQDNKKIYCLKLIYILKKFVVSLYHCSYLDNFQRKIILLYKIKWSKSKEFQNQLKEKLTGYSVIKYPKDILEGIVQANQLGIFLPNIKLENTFLDYNNNNAKICILELEDQKSMNELKTMLTEFNQNSDIFSQQLKNQSKKQTDLSKETSQLDNLQKQIFSQEEQQYISQKKLNKLFINQKTKQNYQNQCISLGQIFYYLTTSSNSFNNKIDYDEIIKVISQIDQFVYSNFFQQTIKQLMIPEQSQFIDLCEILLRYKGILAIQFNLESQFNETFVDEKFVYFDKFNEIKSFEIGWIQIAQENYFPIIQEEEQLEQYLQCYKTRSIQFETMENQTKEQLSKIEKQEKIIFQNNKIIKKLQEQLDAQSDILKQINFNEEINSQKQSKSKMQNYIEKQQQKQIDNTSNKEPGYYCKDCRFVNKYIYEDYDTLIYLLLQCVLGLY